VGDGGNIISDRALNIVIRKGKFSLNVRGKGGLV